MSKEIKTLQDALAYELQGMVYGEKKLNHEFHNCRNYVTSAEVRHVIEEYVDNADNVNLKLERIFNYLMVEPIARKNEVINKLIDETQHLLTYTTSPHLKDILMIGCIRNVNAYKAASYQTSYLMATELEMDTPADLIQQILELELNTGKALSCLSIHEFNKINDPTHHSVTT